MNGLRKKSGTHQKDKFNPSSRELPEEKYEKAEAAGDIDYDKPCYAPGPSQDSILRKLAENARDETKKRLRWERKSYREIIKIVAIAFLIIGLCLGIVIGGVFF